MYRRNRGVRTDILISWFHLVLDSDVCSLRVHPRRSHRDSFVLTSLLNSIEHLTEDILSEFAPVILGVYLPRLLLITTPSYTFNARFTAPDAPASARNGHPDPTGRTSRIFRHHDHKFEWTVEEFKQWCDATALEWGYTVDVSTVGKASEVDEWGRDDALGGASQVAMFKRIDNPELEQNRAEKSKVVVERASRRTKHELLTTHLHAAHPRSQKPGSLQEIGESVKLKMEAYREAFMGLQEIWFEQDIAILCGGWIELLVEAVKAHEKLKLHWNESEKRANWQIELTDGVQQQRVFWPPKEDENSLDYIPPDYFPEEVNNVRSWETESSGIDGDVSAGNSGDEDVDFWGHRERPTWAMKDHAETVGVDQSSTEGESDDQWKGEARITQGGTWGCSAEETSSVDDEKSDEESA